MGPAAGDPRGPRRPPLRSRRPAGRALHGHHRRQPARPVLPRRRRTGPRRHPARRRPLPAAPCATSSAWLQYGRRDAITALDRAGAGIEAADLEASLGGADVTAKGIFQTARTATKALTSERTLRWITPPDTWRTPPPDTAGLDAGRVHASWIRGRLLADATRGPATIHLLSKEGAGTAAPVVAALVDRILEVAELTAQAAGGRLDPPVVAVLDEAANICPIPTLPQLYSHFGSRGIQVITMLQSYQQGVGVWGAQGMDALWSAATVKLVGAGVDDHEFLHRLSGLIGDHDVEKISTSYGRGHGPSRQYSTTRQPVLPVSTLRALPRTHAVLLATGRRAGLGELQPWYRERDAADITAYADHRPGRTPPRRRRRPRPRQPRRRRAAPRPPRGGGR